MFKYCDDNQLPLLDLADLRTTLNYLGSDTAKAALADYGGIAPASLGVISILLDPATFQQLVATGSLSAKYAATIDRQSAHEIITARIQAAQQAADAAQAAAQRRSVGLVVTPCADVRLRRLVAAGPRSSVDRATAF